MTTIYAIRTITSLAPEGDDDFLDLGTVADRDVVWYVGADFEVDIETLPLQPVAGRASDNLHQKRVSKANVLLGDTGQVIINDESIEKREVYGLDFIALREINEHHNIAGIQGWQKIQTIRITQTQPVPLRIFSIEWQMESRR